MQMAQPTASPLGILLLVAAIYLVAKSPEETANTGPDGDCLRGDRAVDYGVVAHARSQTRQRGNA